MLRKLDDGTVVPIAWLRLEWRNPLAKQAGEPCRNSVTAPPQGEIDPDAKRTRYCPG